MEEEKQRRAESRDNRRSRLGGGMSFGPKETDQTLNYRRLKKMHDLTETRTGLDQQIQEKMTKE